MSRESEGAQVARKPKWGSRDSDYSPIFPQDRLICPWKAQGSLKPDGMSPAANVSPIRHEHDEEPECWEVSAQHLAGQPARNTVQCSHDGENG